MIGDNWWFKIYIVYNSQWNFNWYTFSDHHNFYTQMWHYLVCFCCFVRNWCVNGMDWIKFDWLVFTRSNETKNFLWFFSAGRSSGKKTWEQRRLIADDYVLIEGKRLSFDVQMTRMIREIYWIKCYQAEKGRVLMLFIYTFCLKCWKFDRFSVSTLEFCPWYRWLKIISRICRYFTIPCRE